MVPRLCIGAACRPHRVTGVDVRLRTYQGKKMMIDLVWVLRNLAGCLDWVR